MQGAKLGGGVVVAMQTPPQDPGDAHVVVCEHVDPAGQLDWGPAVQGAKLGGGVAVAMQAPPQNPFDGHVMVGVHVDPEGQLA